MKYHTLSIDQTFKHTHSEKHGLTTTQVDARLQEYGPNKLQEIKKTPSWILFLRQFNEFIIWILLAALGISAFIGEITDAIIIGIIVLLNAILGFVQEFRAERSIASLQKMSSPSAYVLRDGKEQNVPAHTVVPGDILLLEEGQKIAADARVIEEVELETLESTLTGESTAVAKNTAALQDKTVLAERDNMVFAGTTITHGRGRALVVATGMKTEIGKIAGLLLETPTVKTPLQEKLAKFGKKLTIGILLLCVIIFFIGLARGRDSFEMFFATLSLAVAAVPEGLPAVVTITLALGVQRMVKKNALMRKLPAVETLGSCSVICTDKTGTLTHNQMTVRKLFVNNTIVSVTGEGYATQGKFDKNTAEVPDLALLLRCGALCNNAKLEHNESKNETAIIGDPTEAALLVSAYKADIKYDTVQESFPREKEIPFDSDRKLMSTIHLIPKNKKKVMFVKGAPDELLARCHAIIDNGKSRRLSEQEKKQILETNDLFGKKAMRILAFAYKDISKGRPETEQQLTFIGLQAMRDPPRKEVKDAIASCHSAGIRVIMITGDHAQTATAIAKDLQIPGKVIAGHNLDDYDDDELPNIIKDLGIVARASPEHKTRIVTALQKIGHVVAMTGDGVNDAPSLKRADIGVAMGKSGTDVAKEASSMIVTDDNFTSIVDAVKEGRTIYSNIKKSIDYLLTGNTAEVLVILCALLVGLEVPLLAIHILWINLVTDGLPALALGALPEEHGTMKEKPRKKSAPFLDKALLYRLLVQASIITIGTLGVFYYYLEDITKARTMAFTALVFFELFRALGASSSKETIFEYGLAKSKYVIGAIALSFSLHMLLVYSPLQTVFELVPLTLYEISSLLLLASTIFIVQESYKWFTPKQRQ